MGSPEPAERPEAGHGQPRASRTSGGGAWVAPSLAQALVLAHADSAPSPSLARHPSRTGWPPCAALLSAAKITSKVFFASLKLVSGMSRPASRASKKA